MEFEQIRNSTNVLSDSKFHEFFKCFDVEFEFKSLFYDWFHMHRVQTSLFFPEIQPITQTTIIECAT